MNRYTTRILLLYILTLHSCLHSEIKFPEREQESNPNTINFRTETKDDFATRASGYTTDEPHPIKSMGIFAAYSEDPWEESVEINFMPHQKVERTNTSEPWQYAPEKLWPGSGFLSFFAYAPHQDNEVWGNNKPSFNATTGIPILSYTIAPTHDKQVDLLVATPLKDQTKKDYLTIPLRHSLTKIAFSARVVKEPAAGVSYKISRIELKNLYQRGSIAINGAARNWTVSGTPDATYALTNAEGGGIKDLPLTATYQSITPADGHLLLLPQTLDETAVVEITYQTIIGNEPPTEQTKSLPLHLAISRWNAGDAYNLLFAIENEVTFIVAPTPWDNTEIQSDIKNRILNVTRIEANVYPGVATRIYFWSNQPKDSVYVRKEGNLDNGRYPTGTPYTVNNLFDNLSQKEASNLHYNGFDGIATTTGEGYIDVWHLLDASGNPVTPFTDGDKRHIWINASGLARNILLNTIMRGNPTTTPYIGTFHRWSETGERIITWGYNDNWTAEIDTEPTDHEQVLIDNLPSPFMATGQLYGNSNNVGDPETAQLGNTSTTAFSGKGRVYFRVGWKSRLSNRTLTRYARIKVSGKDIGGSGKNRVFLYLRQGEVDDYVFDYSYPDRTSAVKWSPYNLTVAGLTTGGSVQLTANRENARFVQYPTQAGGIYKWANSDVGVHPSAYAPTGSIAFTPTVYNGFWHSILSVQESCPTGYRRPNRGSIGASVASGTTVEAEVVQSLFETINYNAATDSHSNSLWGYYADGFFDRRKVENATNGLEGGTACAVDPSLATVGYIGRLFYNPLNLTSRGGSSVIPSSLFFPAAGYRSDSNQRKGGVEGHYWSSSGMTIAGNTQGWRLVIGAANTANTNTADLHGMSIRCIRDIGFTTELPDYNETVVPTTLSYTAHSNPIDAPFINKWNAAILNDIASLPIGGHKVRSKVTFTGTLPATTYTVLSESLLNSNRLASGSTITYDFSQTGLTWTNGAIIKIEVFNSDWDASINGGAYSSGGVNSYAILNNKGTIVLRKR